METLTLALGLAGSFLLALGMAKGSMVMVIRFLCVDDTSASFPHLAELPQNGMSADLADALH